MGVGFKREADGARFHSSTRMSSSAAAKSATILCMNLGLPELLVILAIIILVFGANRLPDLGRGIGRAIRNFKEATNDGRDKRD
jgi:sec-independent protein translocase protein TatA